MDDRGDLDPPHWWTYDMSYRYFLAMRAWHQARRLWVKAHPDPDAAISALHPEWSEQRLLGAMYGARERTR